jgi:hypothetical protein
VRKSNRRCRVRFAGVVDLMRMSLLAIQSPGDHIPLQETLVRSEGRVANPEVVKLLETPCPEPYIHTTGISRVMLVFSHGKEYRIRLGFLHAGIGQLR